MNPTVIPIFSEISLQIIFRDGKFIFKMMERAERCRNFGELVADFHEGNEVVFPLDMSYF